MIEVRLSLLMILAHLLGDFVLQDEKIIQMRFPKNLNQVIKRSKIYSEANGYKLNYTNWLLIKQIFGHTLKGNLIHAGIHGITLAVCIGMNNVFATQNISPKFLKAIFIKCDMKLIIMVIGFTLCHFFVDTLKVEISYRSPKSMQKVWLFLIDQMAHLFSFYGLMKYYGNYKAIWRVMGFITSPISFMQDERLIWIGINFIGMTFFAGIFISQIIKHIDHNQHKSQSLSHKAIVILERQEESEEIHNENTTEIHHGGYIIGVLERILILCALLMSQPQFIGYILTAKSIARLSKLKEDRFAEYFLIGNSLSFIIAIIGGNIIKALVLGE